MLLRANPMLKKMLLRANPPEEVAPTGKPHSIGFARRSNAVTYKRQRKWFQMERNCGQNWVVTFQNGTRSGTAERPFRYTPSLREDI